MFSPPLASESFGFYYLLLHFLSKPPITKQSTNQIHFSKILRRIDQKIRDVCIYSDDKSSTTAASYKATEDKTQQTIIPDFVNAFCDKIV